MGYRSLPLNHPSPPLCKAQLFGSIRWDHSGENTVSPLPTAHGQSIVTLCNYTAPNRSPAPIGGKFFPCTGHCTGWTLFLGPLASLPRRRCFTFRHFHDSGVWRVLTTTNVEKVTQGQGKGAVARHDQVTVRPAGGAHTASRRVHLILGPKHGRGPHALRTRHRLVLPVQVHHPGLARGRTRQVGQALRCSQAAGRSLTSNKQNLTIQRRAPLVVTRQQLAGSCFRLAGSCCRLASNWCQLANNCHVGRRLLKALRYEKVRH